MIQNYLNRLEYLDSLIRQKCTGPPVRLAQRLNISLSTLYEYLNVMKDMGAPVCYCKIRQSYYYLEEGRFCMKFMKKSKEG